MESVDQQLKCMYLHGLLDAGHSHTNLSHFLEITTSNQIYSWDLDQLRDAGQLFAKTHKTLKETQLEDEIHAKNQEIENSYLENERKSEIMWKNGFVEGAFMLNQEEKTRFWDKFNEIGISEPEKLTNTEFKECFVAFREENKEVFEKIAEKYRRIEANCEEKAAILPADSVSSSQKSSNQLYEMPCRRLVPSPISSNPSLTISVLRQERKSWLSLFSSTYYLVSIDGGNRVVERGYGDFERLATSLEVAFPAYTLPPLPSSESAPHSFEWYLTSLLHHPTLSHTSDLTSFLSDTTYHPSHASVPTSIGDMWALEGVTVCDVEEAPWILEWLRELIIQDRKEKDKLRRCLDEFREQQVKACAHLQTAAASITYITNLHATIPQYANPGIWDKFGQIVSLWRLTALEITSLLSKSFCNYLFCHYISLEKLLSHRETLLNEYKLNRNSAMYRDLYGYFNYKCKTEPEFLMKSQGEVVKEVCEEMKGTINRLLQEI